MPSLLRWLILGAGGYVGTHLSREFTRLGVPVARRGRADGDFRVAVDPGWFKSAGAVLLLAGPIRHPSSDVVFDDNVLIARATVRAFEAAARRPALFFLSSLHVYTPSNRPFELGHATLPPRNVYGAAKLACEAILSEAAARLGFPLWIGRAGNLVALEPPRNPLSFVADFRAGARSGGRLEVRDDPVRDLVLLPDFARGLLVRQREMCDRGVRVENVCTGRPVRIVDVAEAAVLQAGSRVEVRLVKAVPTGRPDVLLGVPPADRRWGDGPSPDDLARLIVEEP